MVDKMGKFDWRKQYAIKAKHDSEFNWIPEIPGIYLWTRKDEEINKTYFYIGQAINLKNRHFDYYQLQCGLAYPGRHFEASLKAHKDWKYEILEKCPRDVQDVKHWLNTREAFLIKEYMKKDNYITRNDSLTGRDVVTSNKKRVDKIEASYKTKLKTLLKRLEFRTDNNCIVIKCKRNKDLSINKVSEAAMTEFIKWLEEINK